MGGEFEDACFEKREARKAIITAAANLKNGALGGEKSRAIPEWKNTVSLDNANVQSGNEKKINFIVI